MNEQSFLTILKNYVIKIPLKTIMSISLKKGLRTYKTLRKNFQIFIKRSKKILKLQFKWHLAFWTVKKIKLIFISLIVILSMTIMINLIRNNSEIIKTATTQQPETFTELYFENHQELPKLLAEPNEFNWYYNPNTRLYSFAFTIINHENKLMNYTYTVSYFEHEEVLIDTNETIIQDDASKTIYEQFSLPINHSRIKVTVDLPNQDQQIFFWINGTINEN